MEGVPVGTEQFQRDCLQEAVNRKPAQLVRALFPMEDARASFQILRISATSGLSHLLRTVPPSITCQAAANFDALVGWALVSIIAGDGAAAAGLPTPEEVAHDLTVCQNQTYGRPTCQSEKAAMGYQQQLHQRRDIYRLPHLGLGTYCHCLRPGERSIPSWTAA